MSDFELSAAVIPSSKNYDIIRFMKIYIAHSREFDYQTELYQPIRHSSGLPQSEIILPHEPGYENHQDRDFYKTLDIMIAEVSCQATGLGIELGWAKDDGTPIICVYKKGAKISGSLKAVTDQFYEYHDDAELIKIIETQISYVRAQR